MITVPPPVVHPSLKRDNLTRTKQMGDVTEGWFFSQYIFLPWRDGFYAGYGGGRVKARVESWMAQIYFLCSAYFVLQFLFSYSAYFK